MKPNAQYRLAVYVTLFLVYFVETRWTFKNILPESIRQFLEEYRYEIITFAYLALVYYYYALDYH